MAALIRHASFGFPVKTILTYSTVIAKNVTRCKSKKVLKKPSRRFQDDNASLATKGFLRFKNKYDPPMDVSSRIDSICESQGIPINDGTKLEDPLQRFKVFLACEEELQHSITNSTLYSIETIGDLKQYYQSPVGTTTPFDAMQSMDLPPNLHIHYDYVRFHPDTDTMFNGKTAFPKSSTLVTGLKYKKKYKGHQQDDPYLDELMRIE